MNPKVSKVWAPLLPLEYNGRRGAHTFFYFWTHLQNKGCSPDVVVLHNRLCLSSEPWDGIIFWIIWCTLLPQHSVLHDLIVYYGIQREKFEEGIQTFKHNCTYRKSKKMYPDTYRTQNGESVCRLRPTDYWGEVEKFCKIAFEWRREIETLPLSQTNMIWKKKDKLK